MEINLRESKYKVEFTRHEPRYDEATGKIWRAGTTSVLVYKRIQKKILCWSKPAWKLIAYYSHGGLLDYSTKYFTEVEHMRSLLYNEIGLNESERLYQ